MRHIVTALAGVSLLFVAACGGAGTPAATTPAPTTPGPPSQVVFTADLKTTNEVPPIANEERTGSGTATITFNLTRSAAGALSGATANFEFTLQGFPTTTRITLAHIHTGTASQNGAVRVNTGLTPDTAITLTSGGTTVSRSNITVEAALAQDIMDYPENYYFNVHSGTNPGGVVRGQLVKR